MSKPILPGKLGNPETTLATDPRLDPRLVRAMSAGGDLPAPGGLPIPGNDASYEDCLAYCAAYEETQTALHPQAWSAMPEFPNVSTTTETITGTDGNDITLHIHKPATPTTACVVHLHGGGMVMMTAEDPSNVRWRNSLASAGLVVVGVEFRNGGGRLGVHPYPAGLNDCASATRWAYANKSGLGVSSIIVSGESGGANLAIATALKANTAGWADEIDGVYAMCPYISGDYANPPDSLASLIENEGYLIGPEMMAALVRVYDPEAKHTQDPLAWPWHAGLDELRGLPPHVISVNELDPLRDEGIEFYRRLLAAGVPAVGRTVHGTPHAGDKSFPDMIGDVFAETIGSVCAFARSLNDDSAGSGSRR